MSMFNPETMKNLMENEDIQKMMNDPKIMGNLQNMMGNMGDNDLFKGLNTNSCPDETNCCPDEPNCCPDETNCCPDKSKCCPDETNCCPDKSKCCPDKSKCCPDKSKCCPDKSKCCPNEPNSFPDECDINIEKLENIEISESRLNIGDKIVTKNLKNELYNNKNSVIEELLPNGRFVITIDDKTIAVKEENLENIYENIENID